MSLADQPTLACSVCYGDASSELVKGAQAGMLVLVGVIGTVLLGFISVVIFWARRAARLENPGEGV